LENDGSRHLTIYKKQNWKSREKITQGRIRVVAETASERVLVH
jgi:hypothetical protein